MSNVIGIIQVRMGSTRLPGKALLPIGGKPTLKFLFDRLQQCTKLDGIIIATSNLPRDQVIVDFAKEQNIPYYAGSEMDIVDRHYQACVQMGATAMVRITADCPLADPALIDELVGFHMDNPQYDYVTNVHPATFPDGLDLDVVTFPALKRLWDITRGDEFNAEWFYNVMKERPEEFKRHNITHDPDLSAYRLTVDYQEDLELVQAIVEKLGETASLAQIMELIENDSAIKALHDRCFANEKFQRNIAYTEALEKRDEEENEEIEVQGQDSVGKSTELYHPFIVGERIFLRGFEKEDLKGNYFQWANDEEVTRYLFMGAKPNHLSLLEEQYEKSIRDPSEVQFLICDKENNNVIGFCGIHRIEWISRHCEYRVFIGEKEYWGKRIGSEVAGLLLTYAFDKLNMNKVWLGVNANHVAGVKSYERAGFTKEGVLRQEIYRNGQYYDAVRMSVLRDEFYNTIKQRLENPK